MGYLSPDAKEYFRLPQKFYLYCLPPSLPPPAAAGAKNCAKIERRTKKICNLLTKSIFFPVEGGRNLNFSPVKPTRPQETFPRSLPTADPSPAYASSLLFSSLVWSGKVGLVRRSGKVRLKTCWRLKPAAFCGLEITGVFCGFASSSNWFPLARS